MLGYTNHAYVGLYTVQHTSSVSACISSSFACRTAEWARRASLAWLAEDNTTYRKFSHVQTLFYEVFVLLMQIRRFANQLVSVSNHHCLFVCVCTCDCWISLSRDRGGVCVLSRMLSSPRFRAFCCRERFKVRNSNTTPCSCSICTQTHSEGAARKHTRRHTDQEHHSSGVSDFC